MLPYNLSLARATSLGPREVYQDMSSTEVKDMLEHNPLWLCHLKNMTQVACWCKEVETHVERQGTNLQLRLSLV